MVSGISNIVSIASVLSAVVTSIVIELIQCRAAAIKKLSIWHLQAVDSRLQTLTY